MKLLSNLNNFLVHNHHKRLTLAVYAYSGWFRICILLIKPKYLRNYWGEEGKESEPQEPIPHYRYAVRVSHEVNRVCNKTQWESKCLVRALTAQKLLVRKNIHSTLYLGCGIHDQQMRAHAWLRCGEIYVTGGDGTGYSVVDTFYK